MYGAALNLQSMVRRVWVLNHICRSSQHEADTPTGMGLMNSWADTGRLQNSYSGRIV